MFVSRPSPKQWSWWSGDWRHSFWGMLSNCNFGDRVFPQRNRTSHQRGAREPLPKHLKLPSQFTVLAASEPQKGFNLWSNCYWTIIYHENLSLNVQKEQESNVGQLVFPRIKSQHIQCTCVRPFLFAPTNSSASSGVETVSSELNIILQAFGSA